MLPASSVVSIVAILSWFGVMPIFSYLGALAVDVLVLVGVLAPWVGTLMDCPVTLTRFALRKLRPSVVDSNRRRGSLIWVISDAVKHCHGYCVALRRHGSGHQSSRWACPEEPYGVRIL